MPDKSRSNRLNNFLLLRAYFSRVFIGVPPCMMNRLNQNRFRAVFNLKQCSLFTFPVEDLGFFGWELHTHDVALGHKGGRLMMMMAHRCSCRKQLVYIQLGSR